MTYKRIDELDVNEINSNSSAVIHEGSDNETEDQDDVFRYYNDMSRSSGLIWIVIRLVSMCGLIYIAVNVEKIDIQNITSNDVHKYIVTYMLATSL